MSDRKPLPPPFPIGATLRYTGAQRTYAIGTDGSEIPLRAPGQEVTICKTRPGYRGTLQPLFGEWDGDDPPVDTTQDGYSVYEVAVPGFKPQGRIIWPADAKEWEHV